MKITRKLTLCCLLLLCFTGSMMAQHDPQYVIIKDGHFLAHTGSGTTATPTDATTFNPATCLWYSGPNIEYNYYFIDADSNYRYLSAPLALGGTLGLSASHPGTVVLNKTDQNYYFYDWDHGVARGVQLSGVSATDCENTYHGLNDQGTECWKVVWVSYENEQWQMSSEYSYDPTTYAARYKRVTVTEHAAQVIPAATNPGGASNLAGFAMTFGDAPHPVSVAVSNFSYTYTPAYTAYAFDGNTYYYNANGGSLPNAPTPTGISNDPVSGYAWELTGPGTAYLSLSSATGASTSITYNSPNTTSSHVSATLKLTVTYSSGGFEVRTATVTAKTQCQNPQVLAPTATYQDVTISWLPTDDSYTIYWQKDGDGDSWQDVSVGNVTSHTFTGLDHNQKYNYKVKADCTSSTSPLTTHSFITLAEPEVVILGAIYGGGRMADVNGNTEVQMINCDSVGAVYGGNDIAGTVSGGATIILGNNTSTKVRVFDVYGGGNGYYAYNGTSFTAASDEYYSQVVAPGGQVRTMTQTNQLGDTAWTNQGTSSVTLTFPKIKQSKIIVANDAVRIDSLFGGAKNAFLTYDDWHYDGDSIAINGGTIYAVFGANNIGGGQGKGKHHIEVNNTKTNPTATSGHGRDFGIAYLYGGGNKVYGSTTEVYINGGQLDTIFAGGNSASVYAANLTVNCPMAAGSGNNTFGSVYSQAISSYSSTVTIDAAYPWDGTGVYNIHTLFGGNNRAMMTCMPNIILTSGSIGTVYGGGNAGDMMAQTSGGSITFDAVHNLDNLTFDFSTKVVVNSPTVLIDYLYGGCQMSNVGYSTWVRLLNGHVGTVYGGCNISGDVGSTRKDLTQPITNPGGLYQQVYGATYVEALGGKVYKDIFAGSNGFYHCVNGFGVYTNQITYDPDGHSYVGMTVPTHNETHVVLNGSVVVNHNVYAGGNMAPVGFTPTLVGHSPYPEYVGLASVRMIGGEVKGDVYGGGRMASINGSNEVRVTGGSIGSGPNGGALYGGNDRLGKAGGISNRVMPEAYNTASDNITPLTDSQKKVKTYVGVTGNPQINTVYGGGNGAYKYTNGDMQYCDTTDLPIQSNIFVDIAINGGDDGGFIETVYGGGNGVYASGFIKVFLNVQSCTGDTRDHVGTIFGGNNLGEMDRIPDIILLHGNVHTVYGGCNKGELVGDSTLTVNNVSYDHIGGYVHLRKEYSVINTSIQPTPIITPTTAKVTGAVYGGCRMNGVRKNTLVLVDGGNHSANLFGGSDISGNVGLTSRVIVKGGTVGNVYGGGNGNYYYDDNKVYNINDHSILIDTSDVNITAPISAVSQVDILGGQVGATGTGNARNIFGGGYGHLTETTGNVMVNIGNVAAGVDDAKPTIFGDIYGGSALGDVNTNDKTTTTLANISTSTTVNYLNGTITGNVYGGGLGSAPLNSNGYINTSSSDPTIEAFVYGNVQVNIGNSAAAGNSNYVNINGSVFGGNNLAGTPKGDVNVDVYRTAHTTANSYPDPVPVELPNSYFDNHEYAINEVYGGGNLAAYNPLADAATNVYIHNCDNTIKYVYGGGNAADVPTSNVTIDGGLVNYVFGGGNGAGTGNPGANVNGNNTLALNGGLVGYVFGGSNMVGMVHGETSLQFAATPTCSSRSINELYGGGNQAACEAITLNVPCGTNGVKTIYGGSKNANVTGNSTTNVPGDVTLNVHGGILESVFGGNNQGGVISGNVTVNLFGGTIDTVFGGNNKGGNILGVIAVNVLDEENTNCPLNLTHIFGGSNEISYAPDPATTISPVVNVVHITQADGVQGNVYGGGNKAGVTSNPKVNIGYVQSTMSSYLPTTGYTMPSTPRAYVKGNVYGGGNEAGVTGNPVVNMNNGTVVSGIYGGCNTKGTVAGDINVNIYDGTLGTSTTAMTEGIFGGGKGGYESSTNPGTTTTGNVTVTIGDGSATPNIYADVYGGSAFGQVGAASKLAKVDLKKGTVHGKIFGGGMGDESHTAEVTGDAEVAISGGSVLDSIFGGCNVKGIVRGDAIVGITSGTLGSASPEVRANVYGGGLGENTKVSGNVAVTVDSVPDVVAPVIYGDVYGGSAKGLVNCTDAATPAHNGTSKTEVTLTKGTIYGNLYGGGHGMSDKSANVYGPVAVLVEGGRAYSAFGCNNLKGAPLDTVTITVTNGVLDTVCGGGNQANYIAPTGHTDYPAIYIQGGEVTHKVVGGCNAADITGNPHVNISGGNVCTTTVNSGVYGGCNESGTVTGDVFVNITGQATIGSEALALADAAPVNVHGGGYGEGTHTTGDVTVNFGTLAYDNTGTEIHTEYPMLFGDLYGGSALGDVNDAATDKTTVNILNGTVRCVTKIENIGTHDTTYYYSGRIYGGGLGDKTNSIAAKVYGEVHVNIGSTETVQGDSTVYHGKASLVDCEVYGCNNAYGSPQENVYVDVYQTTHVVKDSVNYLENDATYAIKHVFGGGNEAHYAPDSNPGYTKKTHSQVHKCDNTIDYVYGGGNAADSDGTVVNVDGGRFNFIFGGGNGQVSPANILTGGVNITISSGYVGWYFNGCNMQGTVPKDHITEQYGCTTECPCGDDTLNVLNYYFGANQATIYEGLDHTISCGDKMTFINVYAGSRLAVVYGDINLTVRGGEIRNLYGGNEGSQWISADVRKYPADSTTVTDPKLKAYLGTHPEKLGKGGNIYLKLEGGKLGNVYGGNNYRGNVEGNIYIEVDSIPDLDEQCRLEIDNIYGGNNLAAYEPLNADTLSPVVYLKRGHVNYDVYGGSMGGKPEHNFGNGRVRSNPKVIIGDENGTYKALVKRDVFGGGNAGDVQGNTKVILQGNTIVGGDVYGGSKQSNVTGSTEVILAPPSSKTDQDK